MAENAWLNFYCETDKQVRVATFRLVGKEWHLIEVSADPLPEGGAIPGRISLPDRSATRVTTPAVPVAAPRPMYAAARAAKSAAGTGPR
jgi:hypothetical protein